ncbi:Uncharacterised protein [Yersinia similis]|uniref:Uncharacterized protein n=1 Tax=Yersinia similis TaxID=367190 RepID=A0A0T9QLF2_9GAMM|nr:Uncharacterised protein [Yersinia similis]CNB12898.1 Uncharacterised protein [Yersinia similis]CNE78693.1 Uncharacterised protein [Yersinia similis]CNF15944.1 Uncharacterised protein [Yersinia similis]CNI17590.1 Uncharacterised protein [Yersinia similis]
MVGCAVTILQKLMSNRVKKSVAGNAIFAMSFQSESGIGNEHISNKKAAIF